MCGSNACSTAGGPDFRRISAATIDGLQDAARNARPALFTGGNVTASILSFRHGAALEFLSTDPADMRSILILQKFGNYGALDLVIERFEVNYPKVLLILRLTFDPFGGGTFRFSARVTIECNDITRPAGCSVDLDLTGTDEAIKPLIDWDCIKRCAPQCISCGSDWSCWLGCAGGCILQCL